MIFISGDEMFLGIDIGTTNIKAAVITEEGSLASFASRKTPAMHPTPDYSEYDPEDIFRLTVECVKELGRKEDLSQILSIGISSMGESGILVDRNGNALTSFIAWYDQRAKEQSKKTIEQFGAEKIYSITGQIPSEKYGVLKLLWLKENQPEAYDKAAFWMSMEDWIIFRLTGSIATDYSIASRTLLFDIQTCEWSETLIDGLDLKKELFSRAFEGGTPVGTVMQSISQITGIRSGTPVCLGGHDHACAGIAINIFKDGVVLDSMGTAEVSMISLEKPVLSKEAFAKYYSFYPHCGRKKYRAITSNQSCGACIEWYIDSFSPSLRQTTDTPYEKLIEQMNGTENSCSSLIFLPFIRGSVENVNYKGVFFGIRDTDRGGDFIRAIIDGLCFELKKQIEDYSEILAFKSNLIRVVGGLTRSREIMKRKSEIQETSIEIPSCTEAACTGAALLSAIGTGRMDYEDLENLYTTQYVMKGNPSTKIQSSYQKYLYVRNRVTDIYKSI